jgi:hypothetical protein
VRSEEIEGEEELTRSQIKNRRKKEKKLREETTKANGVDVSEGGEEDEAREGESTKTTKEPPHAKKLEKRTEAKDTISSTPKDVKNNATPNGTSTAKPIPSTSMPPPTASKAAAQAPTPKLPTTSASDPSNAPKPNGIKTSPSHRASLSRSPSVTTSAHSPQPNHHPTPTDVNELRARLAERIAQSRIARKAVGTSVSGVPHTREAILKARAARKARVEEKIRQKKEAQKELGKGENGVGVKEEESSDDEIVESGLTFGRVTVGDTEVDAGKGEVKVGKKKRGPSDPKGILNHLVAKNERLDKMDPEKKEKAVENDRWHHALLAARGEKVRDDMGLLKKTIARKEREKKKSKKDWGERLARVDKAREDRQKKREENLAKRREEKGGKGKKVVKSKKPLVKKKRPGFEGGRMKIGRK